MFAVKAASFYGFLEYYSDYKELIKYAVIF